MWTCQCGCRNIAADLTRCPMCTEEKAMPKATSGGASNAWEEQEAAAQAPVADPAPATPAEETEPAAPETPAVPAEEPKAPAETPAVDVTSMTKAQLQDHADSLGLPTDGTKADLAARITDHVESATAETEPTQPEATP